MHEQRKDREWEHWPGRKHPDEGLKGRLRALFTPGCMAAEILVHEGTPESVVLLTRWDVAPVFEEAPPDDLFVRARAQHLQTLRPEIT